MSKIAFIYPGQGAQKAGMGADFYENSEIARYIFDQAGEELDLDMKELCFEENDRLDLTEYTQAAMVTTCLAMTRVAESKGLKADITAGLSLGEYPAIAAAGGMNDMDAIRLVRKRGILMQNTVPAGEGAMCAVISMAAEEIEKVIEPIADVSVANYNCPGQIVITGKTDAVEEAAAKYGFETEYIWVLIEIREITVDYQRADIDIIDDESIQDFINRNKKGITLMYIEKLERYCMDKSQVCSIYASLLGKQDKEITMYKGAKFLYDALQSKWLKQCDRMRHLEKELALEQTTCRTCWLKRLCMIIRK